jgi:hypothetical protein
MEEEQFEVCPIKDVGGDKDGPRNPSRVSRPALK